MLDNTERIDGPTPHGGDYAIAVFSKDGKPSSRENADSIEIVEYKTSGEEVYRTYGKKDQ